MQVTIKLDTSGSMRKWADDLARVQHYIGTIGEALPAIITTIGVASEVTVDIDMIEGRAELTLRH